MIVSIKAIAFAVFACFIFLDLFAQSPQMVVPFRLGNKWGYSDTLGKIKIKPKYDTVPLFDYDMIYKGNHAFAQVRLNGRPMIINEKGITVVPPKYDYIKIIEGLEEPTFIISKNNKFGLFAKGKELFPPTSDWLADAYPGLYEVRVNKKSGLINAKGKILIPLIYDELRKGSFKKPDSIEWECIAYGKEVEKRSVQLLKENRLPQRVPEVETIEYVLRDNSNKFIDSLKTELQLDSVRLAYHSAIVYKNGNTGVLLDDGTKKVYFFSRPYHIQYLKYFSANSRDRWNHNSAAFIIAGFNGKYGIINEREEQILPFSYDSIEEKDGFFLLKQNNGIGFFILNTAYPVIQPAYDEYAAKQYLPVSNRWRFTLLKVKKNGRSGFVGENGVAYFKD